MNRSTALPLVAALALAACARGGPTWLPLARGFAPTPLAQVVAEWERDEPPGLAVEPGEVGLTLWRECPASAWSEEGGLHVAPVPLGAFRASGRLPELVGRGREIPLAAPGREPARGEFAVRDGELVLRLGPGVTQVPPIFALVGEGEVGSEERAIAPSEWRVGALAGSFVRALPRAAADDGAATRPWRLFFGLAPVAEDRPLAPHEYRIASGRARLALPPGAELPPLRWRLALDDGRARDGSWQVRVGRVFADGIPVWSGRSASVALGPAPARRLSFRFLFGTEAGNGAPTRARVRLDGVVLWEHERAWRAGDEPAEGGLELPALGRAGARLAFEVEGPPGLGAFLAPIAAPREVGTPGARPWPSPPDLVLFLADTLRADALAISGGTGLAPRMDRFAAQALRCTDARSNAAWTLPSIGSLLTGLHPGRHGAIEEHSALPAELVTLPELLARAGYRTGAITDGSFFSPVFGLDQGFEWFSQHDPPAWDLDRTVAEALAFLERDDGRPVFLVVHTYRVHQPYRTGPEEDRGAYDALLARAEASAGSGTPGRGAAFAALARHAAELRALYDEGVRDLDRGFGLLLDRLEARRWFEHGSLWLASDHGEAFGENGEFFHGGHLWEAKLCIPLLGRGAGIAARTVEHPATLVDLAPTLAALAGVPPDPAWEGESLLALDRARATFAFQLVARSRQVAFREGARKVIMTPAPERLAAGACEEAFDLAGDPREEHNQAAEAWAAELTRRLAPSVLRLVEPLGAAAPAQVSSELREALDHLGYGGE